MKHVLEHVSIPISPFANHEARFFFSSPVADHESRLWCHHLARSMPTPGVAFLIHIALAVLSGDGGDCEAGDKSERMMVAMVATVAIWR